MGKHETANELAILSAGRNPQWDVPATATGIPALSSAGVYLENSPMSLVVVALRESAHRRTARVTIATLDNAAGYTITIGGIAVNFVATGETEEQLIQALAAAIVADAGANALVAATAEDEDGDGVDDTVLLLGRGEAFWTLNIGATGTGVLAAVADADQATMTVWAYPREGNANSPAVWTKVFDAEYTLDEAGFNERFGTAGYSRLYVQLASVDGTGDGASVTYDPIVRIGPCVTE